MVRGFNTVLVTLIHFRNTKIMAVNLEPLEAVTDCPFCYENLKSKIIHEFESVFAIQDQYPVTDGHLLIIPKRHTPDFFYSM
jgi:hypothetical protein